MPSPLHHGTASLCIHEHKGDFPQREVQAGSTSVPVLSPCTNAQVAGSTVAICPSSAASPALLTWAHLLQAASSQLTAQPPSSHHHYSAQPLSAPFSTLFHFSFRNSFRNKSACKSLTTNTSLPEEVAPRSTRRDCQHQTISSPTLLSSPLTNVQLVSTAQNVTRVSSGTEFQSFTSSQV